jgi:hypothetical protein
LRLKPGPPLGTAALIWSIGHRQKAVAAARHYYRPVVLRGPELGPCRAGAVDIATQTGNTANTIVLGIERGRTSAGGHRAPRFLRAPRSLAAPPKSENAQVGQCR